MRQNDHYATLDGLRGLAAVSVLLFHLGHWLGIHGLAANARLSVDLFFCLSGYVLPLAYQPRFERGLTFGCFAWLRIVRLWPMIAAGTLISASYLLMHKLLLHDSAIPGTELAIAAALGLLNLPMPNAANAIGGPQVFPLNGPQYTLFLELVVNAFWALSPRFRTAGFALATVAISFALIGWFGPGGDERATFWRGFSRVFGCFYSGVLVFHATRTSSRWPRTLALVLGDARTTAAALVLTAALFYWPAPLPSVINWVWSLLVSPILVLGGTRISLTGRIKRAAFVLGEVSYPLYAIHYSIFVWLNGAFQTFAHRKMPWIEAGLFFPAIVFASFILLRLYDERLRRALGRIAWRHAEASPSELLFTEESGNCPAALSPTAPALPRRPTPAATTDPQF